MSEIIFGTPEHVAGLSRKALEEDFQWVNDRRMELEGECERLDADNAKLRELVRDYERCSMHADCGRCEYDGTTSTHCPLSPCFPDIDELRELGVEVEHD